MGSKVNQKWNTFASECMLPGKMLFSNFISILFETEVHSNRWVRPCLGSDLCHSSTLNLLNLLPRFEKSLPTAAQRIHVVVSSRVDLAPPAEQKALLHLYFWGTILRRTLQTFWVTTEQQDTRFLLQCLEGQRIHLFSGHIFNIRSVLMCQQPEMVHSHALQEMHHLCFCSNLQEEEHVRLLIVIHTKDMCCLVKTEKKTPARYR